jgi:hypothetical protein
MYACFTYIFGSVYIYGSIIITAARYCFKDRSEFTARYGNKDHIGIWDKYIYISEFQKLGKKKLNILPTIHFTLTGKRCAFLLY